MSCEHCSGTFYLLDQPGMGPCVCCTPEAMARLVAARARTAELIKDNRRRHRAREIADYNELLADLERAADALQSYFVRWGFPARPVTLPDPLLWEIWQSLEDYTP